MKPTQVTLWGTRGSLAAPGPETARYGGNTSCVEVRGPQDTVLVLDAGTGLRRLGMALLGPRPPGSRRIDILLTHLHLDHVQGMGFFGPLFTAGLDVHIWGPASTTQSLRTRLTRYLSPPLFPVRLRELPCTLTFHEVPCGSFEINEFRLDATLICHPGPTVGYRIEAPDGVIAYLPDHEPALGVPGFPLSPEWTSGYGLAVGADLLIHDGQYSEREYADRMGWGHCTQGQAIAFAKLAGVKHCVLFHHDPGRTDSALDDMLAETLGADQLPFTVSLAAEGTVFQFDRPA